MKSLPKDASIPLHSPHEYDFFTAANEVHFEKKKSNLLSRSVQIVHSFFCHRTYNAAKVSASIYSLCLKNPQCSALPSCLAHEISLLAKKKHISLCTKKIQKLVTVLLSGHHQNDLPKIKELEKLKKAAQPHTELGMAIEKLIDKISVIQTWESLGCDRALATSDYESVRFLVKERLIYTILGLQNTSSNGKEQLTVVDGKLHMLVEGHITPVASLVKRFRYTASQLEETNTGKPWNYLLPGGLIQVDRCLSETVLPITRLSPLEMKELLFHASSFEGISFSKDDPPQCVLQIFARKGPEFLNSPLFDGIRSLFGGHCAFHLIDEKGNVYSSGITAPSEENAYIAGRKNKLVSINGVPSITDYEEFRPHGGRLVTSVPMTKKTCDTILKELNEMRKRHVRFHYFTQNCSRFVSYILEKAGVKIDHQVTIYTTVKRILPNLTHLPVFDNIIKKIVLISHSISKKTLLPSIEEEALFIKNVCKKIFTPLRYPCNFILNLILMAFGHHRGSPTTPDEYGTLPGEKMNVFSAPVTSLLDLFKDQTTFAYAPGAILEWQAAQKTTLLYDYTIPNMNVLPGGGKKLPQQEKNAVRLQQPLLRKQRLCELSEFRKLVFSHFFYSRKNQKMNRE